MHPMKRFAAHRRMILKGLILAIGSALFLDQTAGAAPMEAFAGRWDLTITETNKKQLPSWLELTLQDGVWKASFVGRWGNARALPKVAIEGDVIEFVSPRQEEDSMTDLVFNGKAAGEALTGF